MAPQHAHQYILAFLACLAVLAAVGTAPVILIGLSLLAATAMLVALVVDTGARTGHQ
ncbi:hypothetical protein IU438_12845 [Nocardia cyriacigeorgica]|uniref:hypothetical protein n=2 Tax=Nocardia cyriacigeorgica TaxID=135487 RepID=UPI0012DE0387|nr:hypothetical protein [Nocardia cyriacigeorgica]MBF6095499.1 hypothetical protein [Nocardia cyriacigeorgica]MBF6100776.1 hypothetical protein [Nocardia cyriacigeorgica]MBF6161827.1 hypothetical protein [Nocardia cyriacigeorgica]MBF6200625.1 hypothetical protein [Nocardia cyriacigeorgica]MBF6317341.1 hypothetical protein [Nocardia cyriacigeorgica]